MNLNGANLRVQTCSKSTRNKDCGNKATKNKPISYNLCDANLEGAHLEGANLSPHTMKLRRGLNTLIIYILALLVQRRFYQIKICQGQTYQDFTSRSRLSRYIDHKYSFTPYVIRCETSGQMGFTTITTTWLDQLQTSVVWTFKTSIWAVKAFTVLSTMNIQSGQKVSIFKTAVQYS